MLIPYSLPLEKKGQSKTSRPWNDPVRALYPHHAELWPAEIPEHHRLLALHLRLARKKRRLMVLKLLRWCLGRSPGPRRHPIRPKAANDTGAVMPGCGEKRPQQSIVRFFDPLKRRPAASREKTRPEAITPPTSAAGCHGDCR